MAQELDDLFGENDVQTLEDDAFADSPAPGTSTKNIKPASEEDKKKAELEGKETPEEKLARVAREQEELRIETKKALEAEWDEDPTKKDKDNKPDPSTTSDTEVKLDDETTQSFATDLYKLGLLTKFEEDEEPPTTQAELLERLTQEWEFRAEELVNDFAGKHGEVWKKAFNDIFVNGANPEEYIPKFNSIQTFKGMDMTDEDNQVRVVEAALTKEGWDPEDIKGEIKRLKLNSELEDNSVIRHKLLVKREEAELVESTKKSKLQLEQKQAAEAQYLHSVDTILADKVKTKEFDGIPITLEDAKKVKGLLTDKRWKLADGTLITDMDRIFLDLNNPQNHSAKVKLGFLFKGYDPNKPITLDLGAVAKTAVSKENKELFNFNKDKKIKLKTTPAKNDSYGLDDLE